MGPSKEALALADFLIARYGLTADRYQLAYAIMEHEEKAMRAEPEQVGEVEGDAGLISDLKEAAEFGAAYSTAHFRELAQRAATALEGSSHE